MPTTPPPTLARGRTVLPPVDAREPTARGAAVAARIDLHKDVFEGADDLGGELAEKPSAASREKTLYKILYKKTADELRSALADGSVLKADLSVKFVSNNWSAIHVAKNADVISLLIFHGADVNEKSSEAAGAQTPLFKHIANPDIVKVLLAAGADPTIANIDGETPLERAERKGLDEVAALLRAAKEG